MGIVLYIGYGVRSSNLAKAPAAPDGQTQRK
jgi:hypothetical protein